MDKGVLQAMNDMEKLLGELSQIRDDVDFENEKNLVDDGLIDSLDLTQIIAALDDAFDVRISAGEIEPENFNSAEAMLALVHKYQGK
jgi:D-alanine--poly(phosphoribitol) ligase subunit 2